MNTVTRSKYVTEQYSISTRDCHICIMIVRGGLEVCKPYACTVPLTSNLLVHACPLASDSKAARVRCPRYLRVNIRTYASRHTRVRASNEHTQYTRTRIYSVYTQASPTPKESGGLGYEASVSTARESRARTRA